MAQNIISNLTTNKFYSSGNPINVTINSTNNGSCNFRYIADIYINGSRIYRDKLFPDPDTGYGFFQIGRIVEDYISDNIPTTPATTYFNTASGTQIPGNAPGPLISVKVYFGEEYDSTAACTGTVVQYPNLLQTNTAYVYHGAWDYEDYPTYSDSNYVFSWTPALSSKKFMTRCPREVEVTFNDSFYLDFLALTSPSTSIEVVITTTDKDNNTISLTLPATSLSLTRRYRLYVGPYDLNRILGNTFASLFIGDNTKSYTVYLQYSGGTVLSETFTFKVVRPKSYQTRIGFIGSLGTPEFFTFFHRNKKKYSIDRKVFKKTVQGNYGGNWTYQVGDRADTIYGVNVKERHEVSSLCSKETSAWLTELWTSPEVWVHKGPTMYEFKSYIDTSAKIMYRICDENHTLAIGDYVYIYPKREGGDMCSGMQIYSVVISVSGQNVWLNQIVTGMDATTQAAWGTDQDTGTAGFQNNGSAYGWIVKKESWKNLPIVVEDTEVEEKERLGRPIEYTLKYANSYEKNTLR